MNVAVEFTDVEQLCIDVLRPLMAARGMPYPMSTTVPREPAPRPAAFWRLLPTGGNRANIVVDNATLTVESWATTETQASAMARKIRAVIESIAGTVHGQTVIYRTRDFSAPVNLPDPTSDQIRYTSTGSLYLRGVAL